MGNHFSKSRRPQTHLLMVLVALQIWLVRYFYHQKSTSGVIGDVCLMIPAKALLYSLSKRISEVK